MIADGGDDVVVTGAADNFSFFVTSYEQLIELAGSENGFGGDLRYDGAATGLEGADAICQELARRVAFGHRTWRAYLSASTVDAIDRIGSGPWYDFAGSLVADDPSGLTSGDRASGGCCDEGTYDELGIFHDGSEVDDHDTLTATLSDGTYAGFSCDDWTSVTAQPEGDGMEMGGGFGNFGGPIVGHMWPANSGQHWSEAHGSPGCAAGTIHNGGGAQSGTVGGLGGYGAIYCFALAE
jgi:hypothetical protein